MVLLSVIMGRDKMDKETKLEMQKMIKMSHKILSDKIKELEAEVQEWQDLVTKISIKVGVIDK